MGNDKKLFDQFRLLLELLHPFMILCNITKVTDFC